jgi:tetratricopeptide (TPR) repeat protein
LARCGTRFPARHRAEFKLAEIHQHYGLCLVLFGRKEDALAEIFRAVEFEPLSARFNVKWARVLFLVREYDRAIEQFRVTLELDPNYSLPHEGLGYVYEKKGMEGEAITEWAKALILSERAEEASNLEQIYAHSGLDAALREPGRMKMQDLKAKKARGQFVSAAECVIAHMRLGEEEEALRSLANAFAERNRIALEIRIDPRFDPLRAQPRFAQLADELSRELEAAGSI